MSLFCGCVICCIYKMIFSHCARGLRFIILDDAVCAVLGRYHIIIRYCHVVPCCVCHCFFVILCDCVSVFVESYNLSFDAGDFILLAVLKLADFNYNLVVYAWGRRCRVRSIRCSLAYCANVRPNCREHLVIFSFLCISACDTSNTDKKLCIVCLQNFPWDFAHVVIVKQRGNCHTVSLEHHCFVKFIPIFGKYELTVMHIHGSACDNFTTCYRYVAFLYVKNKHL